MPPGQLLEPSLTESDFTLSCLASGIRSDGRSFLTPRPLSISFGAELGNVHVTLGDTRIATSIRATLSPPRADRPYEGFLTITSDISPMAGTEYDASGGASSSARARELLFERLVEKAVRRTEAVDRESLCVVAGEQVWDVQLTLHLLSDAGGALDAAVLACLASLRHFRRNDVSVEGGKVRLFGLDERVGVPLAIHHTPLCVSFALFDNVLPPTAEGEDEKAASTGSVALLDPSLLEEQLAQSKLTLVLNAQREICVLDKSYGSPIDPRLLLDLIQVGLRRVQELTESLDEALRRDAETRVVEVI
ncbi:Exoribonuclease, phosphorolytic domain 2 [Kalmanozyma brasiliensis GHG001]|uniref:Uncharacterized protein n=1 Tax=Kalmanozyma brasiliensis (strain GHG001) TaxID=1365824 RepID=V5E7W2_KALBG|nr:Exoribonuclease, phosphorolytic domain 2 [Kalmanozyma brasiliensis GHG001]EST06411.1 Exoribonuclease, phosphorolytic domain 2 [Kalmanozyma brasiliensis GHG001]